MSIGRWLLAVCLVGAALTGCALAVRESTEPRLSAVEELELAVDTCGTETYYVDRVVTVPASELPEKFGLVQCMLRELGHFAGPDPDPLFATNSRSVLGDGAWAAWRQEGAGASWQFAASHEELQ